MAAGSEALVSKPCTFRNTWILGRKGTCDVVPERWTICLYCGKDLCPEHGLVHRCVRMNEYSVATGHGHLGICERPWRARW